MKTNILQDYILQAIQVFENDEEGTILKILLSPTEKLRLCSLIASYIPSNPDMIVDIVLQNVLSFYEKEDFIDFNKQSIKFLLRQYLMNKITPEQQLLLMFYIMMDYKMSTRKSFTLEFKNVQEYFESYILLNTQELTEQIAEDKIQATTKENGAYFIRFTSNNTMVPTYRTKEQFTNYLFNN